MDIQSSMNPFKGGAVDAMATVINGGKKSRSGKKSQKKGKKSRKSSRKSRGKSRRSRK